ncbi:hypothetical protein AHiyo4_09310 [Arthrobacter sp. Hiyo4]|nr:hypothetical protein AHiyo4_09310 [Arthrobacter sp. Hiyo4]
MVKEGGSTGDGTCNIAVGGYNSVRPTVRPCTPGKASAASQVANTSSCVPSGSPPSRTVGMVVAAMTRSISATTGSFIHV